MWTLLDTPVGPLRIVAGQHGGLTAIEFDAGSDLTGPTASAARAVAAAIRPVGDRRDHDPLLAEARRQLAAYFARELKEFTLPLAPAGSAFQRAVWQRLAGIGYGETASYGEIARRLGRTNASARAVGLACGSNPIPIVVPCHRVVGTDGRLTGYAGGLARKQQLLELEQDVLF